MHERGGGAPVNRPDSPGGRAYYEQDATVEEYLAFHFPDGDPLRDILGAGVPPPGERFPRAVRRLWRPRPEGRALDVGAACGRVTFDLARTHRTAVGVDLSHALVRAAARVRASGRARYRTVLEGDLREEHDVAVDAPANARFAVADAGNLPFAEGIFHTVVALNLLDRVPDPARVLDELARVLAPDGTLVLASPYTWVPGFTPRERWLGGFERDGGAVRGREAVVARLAPGLRLAREERMPFFIPHHARSGQLGLALVHVFERKR